MPKQRGLVGREGPRPLAGEMKALRTRLMLSQSEFADVLMMRTRHYQRFERSETTVPPYMWNYIQIVAKARLEWMHQTLDKIEESSRVDKTPDAIPQNRGTM